MPKQPRAAAPTVSARAAPPPPQREGATPKSSSRNSPALLSCPRLPVHCSWVQLHGLLTSENRTGVLRTAGRAGSEVMLVPLMAAAAGGGPPQPIFAGFAASLLAGDFVKEVRHPCWPL